MSLRREVRSALAGALAVLIACPPAQALVALNDGRDRIYVNGTVTVGYDSNVFASNGSEGDFVYSTSVSADYTRRAGWIGVNGSVGVSSSKFAEIDGQDFANPSFSLEFTKQSGRTTGSMTFNAARSSRADPAVNARVESWSYTAGLGFRYPISGTFTLSGNLGYANTIQSNELYSDLESYSAGLDLFHIFTSERDLIGGYRYRHGQTSRSTSYDDHSFSTGVSGKIIRGINGSLRVGYQVRVPTGGVTNEEFSSWTSSGTATYAINKKMNITGSIGKDFSTTATDTFVDTLTLGADYQYAYNSRWSFTSGLSYGNSRFLGESGRVVLEVGPPAVLGAQREDSYLSWNSSLNYSMNEHLKVAVSYTWFKNWSTTSFADFVRTGYSISVSSRW
jgi:hypothetical protein